MKRFLLISILIAPIVILGFVCSTHAAKSKLLEKIKFAHFGINTQRDLFVAKEKGFFEKQGIDCELMKMNLAGVIPAIVGGSVDGGPSPASAALPALAKGVKIKLVLTGPQYPRDEQMPYIGVLIDSPIKSIEDLNGKSMSGHYKGSAPWLAVQIFLKKHRITLSQYVEGSEHAFTPLMLAGKVDAAIVFPEFRVRYGEKIRLIAPLDAFRKIQGGGDYWFSQKFIEERPDLVRRWINALKHARDYERKHSLECVELIQKYTGGPLDGMIMEIKKGMYPEYPIEPLVEVIKVIFTQKMLIELGLMREPIKAEEHIDMRFAKPVYEDPK